MNLFPAFELPFIISGLGVGFIVGITGVGGGALMTPILMLVFGVSPAAAVGTDLLYASITKGFGTLVHGISRSIDWRIVGLLASGSIPAAFATTYILHNIDSNSQAISFLITKVLACAIILTALSLIFRNDIQKFVSKSKVSLTSSQRALTTIVFGLALGVIVTVSSVGAGSIGVSVLILLYPTMPMSRVVGTDIAHAVPLTLVAGLGHLSIGTVDTGLLFSLLSGSILGVILGSYLSPRLPEVSLRYALAIILLAVGTLLLLK